MADERDSKPTDTKNGKGSTDPVAQATDATTGKSTGEKPAAKKSATRKSAAKKSATKKPVAKKSAANTAAKKSAAKKPAAKKSADKKPAARKSAAKKAVKARDAARARASDQVEAAPPAPASGKAPKRRRQRRRGSQVQLPPRRVVKSGDPLADLLEGLRSLHVGQFETRLSEDAEGVHGELARAFNRLAEQDESVSYELRRVAESVGEHGHLTDRAVIAGVSGGWEETVSAVNRLIDDMAHPTIEVSRVLAAVVSGDLSSQMPEERDGQPLEGEFLRVSTTVNKMLDQLALFADEVTRVAREVGTEGVLGGQADVPGMAGIWQDLTESVNAMAANLTDQVRNIALVTTAVATGDLSQKITVDAQGEILELKNTINTMVDQLGVFGDEVTRMAREVGTEGILGGQADVPGVAGTWKDLTDNVNAMAGNLTVQLRDVSSVATAVANGDLSQKITVDARGEILQIKNVINAMVDQLGLFGDEVTRVAQEVGTEGKLGGQAEVPGVAGTWKDLTDSVNALATNLTDQVRNIALVTTAVANGDLSQTITVDAQGEILELKDTINTMVDQLGVFGDEVTRVAREVGTEGILGGQAAVPGVAGTWKDLTDNVNAMAGNLTVQLRDVSSVATAVANGDLSQKITVDAQGEILQIKNVINAMVDQLGIFGDEVTRVAREVGSEGQLGGQAEVPGVAGTWKDLTDSVNALATNLTDQVRNIALVTTAVATGDLSQKITVDAQGEILELKDTINTMVDQLGTFGDEVTRVAREVGTEGILGGQAAVPGVAGTWKDLTDNVNAMAGNLTVQLRDVSSVATAVANGDLSQKITVDAQGEILQIKDVINAMVDRLGVFADEVTRVAREVGTEGQLGGQAEVPGVAGTWKDLTDNVNAMAGNLTVQLRDVSYVATAVAAGDLSQKITVDAQGEILQIKNVINAMVDQLGLFGDEVTRVAREVGSEGQLGGQAEVPGVDGTWKDLTESVNALATNLTDQVRNIALVTTAVATGDLSQKITVDAQGEILELKNTINTMVDQLGVFGDEVTRVAREVGTEGILGGQAEVPGVAGTWKDLTDNVNAMAGNLTVQLRDVSYVATAVANGDLSQKITVDARGEILQIKDVINAMVDRLGVFADEVTRVAREVGTEGILGGQAEVPGVAGTWKDLTDNVNAMAGNLTVQLRDVSSVATAVANGDLSQKIKVDAQGEILQIKNVINAMVDRLRVFGDEVTRVAREVGTEGQLGGQAHVPDVGGTWKDLTESVNAMAGNLTVQLRDVSTVATAVANGDLSQKIMVDAKGEILQIKEVINAMVDQLGAFASEVTRVAREVGTEGKLGGQANVPDADGTWRALTDNVNQLANNLTIQVRAIAEVAAAVTQGDLTRSITVEAQGEVDELRRSLNVMISNLRETTEKNEEQDWLKTNLAQFSRMMQGHKDLESVTSLLMSELTPLVEAQHGAFFVSQGSASRSGEESTAVTTGTDSEALQLLASYGYQKRKHVANRFSPGEGLVGQAALEKKSILLTKVPDDYIQISSGLGEAPPRNILVMPVLFEDQVKAVVELASFSEFSDNHLTLLDQLAETVGVVINMIQANTRTEMLLRQSRSLTEELQSQSQELQQQQEELRRSNSDLEQQAESLRASEELLKEQQEELQQVNEELEEKANLLAEQNDKVEQKNREVETARVELEEKASQLALTSKYKSEFLANMSHELRTPLNSLLILAGRLQDNEQGNLTDKQLEYAQTIMASGKDLITLINDVLDLAKVEAGKLEIRVSDVLMEELRDSMMRSFEPVAEEEGLEFSVSFGESLPESIHTDGKRLQQILKNLLSNSFKFTREGSVELAIDRAKDRGPYRHASLNNAESVIAFDVHDTGIGIAPDKQRLVFEAFQQEDGTTSREFGGTGLGLSISRELADLLGGELALSSTPGEGSTFTLFLPETWDNARSTTARQTSPKRVPGSTASRPVRTPTDSELKASPIPDDREDITPEDKTVLIVEDDRKFARILLDTARAKGFKGIVAIDGESGLHLAHAYRPDAITLDIELPGADGWTILDRLKSHPDTRHIPVHVVSVWDESRAVLERGALAHLEKPISREALDEAFDRMTAFTLEPIRRLLVVEDDAAQADSIVELLGHEDLEIRVATSGEEALAALGEETFHCMVLDLGLKDLDGLEVLRRLDEAPDIVNLPVVIYTGRELSEEEETSLRRYAETIILKDARSPERLLDETALFLHRVEAQLSPPQQALLRQFHGADAVFSGKRVLIVDDDVRNIFALSSLLESRGMTVEFAESGREAVDKLREDSAFHMVLMDIMMPGMDGFETTMAIRELPDLRSLPIIAVTARATKADREACLEAGCSEYVTKPVDTDQLLELMRVWLHA